MTKKPANYFYRNSLFMAFMALTVFSLGGQVFTGFVEHNAFLKDENKSPVGMIHYLCSGHFLQATFENWESEFLQMALFVILTIFLRQQGSSESKPIGKKDEVDREPVPSPNAPWPVRKGGFILLLYKNSLSLVLLLLFLASFTVHFYGSLKDHNEKQAVSGVAAASAGEYLAHSKFWFESFQNWQSEFLSMAAIIIFSVYLRQKGSSQSKPVDTPHHETK